MAQIFDDSNWEPTLKAVESERFWKQLPGRRTVQLLDWPQFVERSRRALSVVPAPTAVPSSSEIYERTIDLAFGGHYQLVWDVARAHAIARRDHLGPPTSYPGLWCPI